MIFLLNSPSNLTTSSGNISLRLRCTPPTHEPPHTRLPPHATWVRRARACSLVKSCDVIPRDSKFAGRYAAADAGAADAGAAYAAAAETVQIFFRQFRCSTGPGDGGGWHCKGTAQHPTCCCLHPSHSPAQVRDRSVSCFRDTALTT